MPPEVENAPMPPEVENTRGLKLALCMFGALHLHVGGRGLIGSKEHMG